MKVKGKSTTCVWVTKAERGHYMIKFRFDTSYNLKKIKRKKQSFNKILSRGVQYG